MVKVDRKLMITALAITCCSLFLRAQLIRHSYHFYDNLSASAPDCGPELEPAQAIGYCNPAALSGSFISDILPNCGLARNVYHNNLHWGLRYPNTTGTISTTYTIHLYVKTTNWGTHLWTRIIDFSNGFSDNGIYYKQQVASPDRCVDFYPNGIVGPCPYFNNTTYYLLTFTRNGATNTMDVYVNNSLFTTYNDAASNYTGIAGTPIYIYRDDEVVPCESGEANFAYLAFTNQYSSQTMVDSVYTLLCSIANPGATSSFSLTPNPSCASENITVTYSGNITSPGTGYTFNWDWDGGTVVSGSGMGPYNIKWSTLGIKNVTLTVINNSCGNQNSTTQQMKIGLSTASTIYQTICDGENYAGYNTAGIYTDTFINASGCDSVRTLDLMVKPKSFSTITQSICEGQSFLGYISTGTFRDTLVAANGCDSIRTLNLTVSPRPVIHFDYNKDLCQGDSLVLYPGVFSTYLWQDGSTKDYFVVKNTGIYSVTVTNSCGAAHDAITIITRSCEIYFPSAFTPNGDGKNDLFNILNALNLQEYVLTVFNRWGQIIFQTHNYSKGWDGKFNGELQKSDMYIWTCRFKKNSIERFLKGSVVLIR